MAPQQPTESSSSSGSIRNLVFNDKEVALSNIVPSPSNVDKEVVVEVAPQVFPASDAVGFDKLRTKRLLRKMDWHLIPWLALLYLMSFLDRSNIGNAKLYNMENELGLTGLMYNTALAIFFPFYVAAEIPSNLMMKATRPSIWIPSIMIAWGFLCLCMGFVKNYAGLLVVRSILGFAEGGLFPGVTFYITMWYRRHECGLRMAIFFSAATLAGAFGGVLARAIASIDGKGNLSGWRWIFIIEGLATFVTGVAAYFIMYDYPDSPKFLSREEKVEVARRLEEDRKSLADEFDMKYFFHALYDWKIWAHSLITLGLFTGLYSFSLFIPTIIQNLGYTAKSAQLMTVPPYAVACVFCLIGGWAADKLKQRGLIMVTFNIIAIIGYILLLISTNPKTKYVGTFLAATGVYPNIPQAVAWNGNNIGGSTKRGVGIAMQVMCGNLGGIVSAYLYLNKDAPHFRLGHATQMAFIAMSALLSLHMTWWLRRENARRDRVYDKRPEEYTEFEHAREREQGDNATFFRYTV